MKNSRIFMICKYTFLLFVIIILGCVSYYYLDLGINNTYERSINYESKSDIDYKVYLLENNFFEEPYLGMNKTYISSLIDYIDVTFDYDLNLSNNISGSYIYYINGTVSADKTTNEGNTDNSYWSKTYTLKSAEKVEFNATKNNHFSTNIKIGYQEYNNILNEFKREYGLNINGILKLELVVKTTANSDALNKEFTIEGKSELDIPLTQQTIDLSIDALNNDIIDVISEEVTDDDSTHSSFVIIGAIITLVDLLLVCLLFRGIRKIYVNKSEYSKSLKKFLNTYDSIIVNSKNLPEIDKLNVINVSSFSELIDAHSEIRMPINYIEEVPDYKSVFVLINGDMAWVYELVNHEYENFVGGKKKINKRKR